MRSKGYRNLHLEVGSDRFVAIYGSVMDAVDRLATSDTVEVGFTSQKGMLKWRRRCYEYQAITGDTFRTEVGEGYTLILRPERRSPDYDMLSMVGVVDGVKVKPDLPPPISQEEQERIMQKVAMATKRRVPLDNPADVFKKGAKDVRRPESGGDESNSGPPGGDD